MSQEQTENTNNGAETQTSVPKNGAQSPQEGAPSDTNTEAFTCGGDVYIKATTLKTHQLAEWAAEYGHEGVAVVALTAGQYPFAYQLVGLSNYNDQCIGIHVEPGSGFMGSGDFIQALRTRPSKAAVIIIEGRTEERPVHEIEDFVAAQVEGPGGPPRCFLILGQRLFSLPPKLVSLQPGCMLFRLLEEP